MHKTDLTAALRLRSHNAGAVNKRRRKVTIRLFVAIMYRLSSPISQSSRGLGLVDVWRDVWRDNE
jgi:hypothetical protein